MKVNASCETQLYTYFNLYLTGDVCRARPLFPGTIAPKKNTLIGFFEKSEMRRLTPLSHLYTKCEAGAGSQLA